MTTHTTKLPDGSAFYITTILSREEALALPLKDRPLNFRISSETYHAVFEAIGEASMCWNPRPNGEVFASEQASDVAVRLCLKVADEMDRLRTALEFIARDVRCFDLDIATRTAKEALYPVK